MANQRNSRKNVLYRLTFIITLNFSAPVIYTRPAQGVGITTESIAAVMPGIDRHTEICDRFYLPAGDCLFVIVHQVANALTRIAVT